ncbi:hypothetical protein EVAR_60114_1 [Eumeta japonica]|uniref:Uncharacterized protein n=1 Tax=Eumeta variegata TaxID=151549 RepID=A0A4C1ZYS3_EUMVA|nr:hypothetical protein EVAR_60114_1 [Eumeta japonica]
MLINQSAACIDLGQRTAAANTSCVSVFGTSINQRAARLVAFGTPRRGCPRHYTTESSRNWRNWKKRRKSNTNINLEIE